jgi:hypothetical protein
VDDDVKAQRERLEVVGGSKGGVDHADEAVAAREGHDRGQVHDLAGGAAGRVRARAA